MSNQYHDVATLIPFLGDPRKAWGNPACSKNGTTDVAVEMRKGQISAAGSPAASGNRVAGTEKRKPGTKGESRPENAVVANKTKIPSNPLEI